ncbi:sigma factor [Rhodococcus opacus M213]|uniref:Sigma factor n=1 Tax=Rhodococcus opacus M213 TaxID=1129896 RepID=K8XNY0_RHOOP|nr:sigma factor [Rhodococcus opacus M213]
MWSCGNRRRADHTGTHNRRGAPISCRFSLTCGNKSEPVTDVVDVVVNDDGPEQRALDSKGEQADERTAEHAAGRAPGDLDPPPRGR